MVGRPRVVAVGVPHHVTQRGNDRRDIFLANCDREAYLDALFEYAERYGLSVWEYCLMTKHVHFVAVPRRPASLARAFGRTHADYARYANVRRRGCGHLWQARFYSCPMDEQAAFRALAYVERNPVRARLAERAEEYRWSSAAAHCGGPAGRLLDDSAWRRVYTAERWRDVLRTSIGEEAFRERIREATGVGLPLGDEAFVESLGRAIGRDLRRRPAGRPKRRTAAAGGGYGMG